MFNKFPIITIISATFLASFTLALALPVQAGEGEITVRPSELNGWLFIDEGSAGSSGSLVVGPDTPPLGGGSAEFILNSASEGMSFQYFDASTVGLALSDVTTLSYCTYVTSAPGPQAVSLQINFDDDVTDSDDSWKGRLVFEPLNSGSVVQGQWQCWDTLAGNWWATGSPANAFAPQSNPQSLPAILGQFPNAGFNSSFGGLLTKAGSGWTSFNGNTDNVVLGILGSDTTFNFEAEPANQNDCKNDGWKYYGFTNQGQCVSYYNQHK